ncbi:helix-turn-helix transcriptional regulator [Halobaculum sp. D14]|uniref:helix-turn-helix transcriptional regulator n=1 Tax=Halobaculum sp. D14 TaxID=3421642 RepID=UPI003EBC08B8
MRHVALLLAALSLLAPAASVGVAAGSSPAAAPATADVGPSAGVADIGAAPADIAAFADPKTTFTVSIRSNHDARWTVTARFNLTDSASRAAFRAYADDYASGGAPSGPSVEVFRNAAALAENATGRQMTVRNVQYNATVTQNATGAPASLGVLRLRFTWTNFATTQGNGTLVVGDAFTTPENGTWMPSLTADQRLVIVPPDGYVPDTSVWRLSNQRVVVEGPETFSRDEFPVTFEAASVGPPGFSLVEYGLGAVTLLLLGAVIYLLVRRSRDGERDAAPERSVPASATSESADGATAPPPETAPESRGAEEAETEPGAAADGDESVEDLELLSDEERVERLLERNGGRMRQAAIVSETGWSDAKVSQLLSSMADEDRVEKLRLGRENLISLPEFDAGGDDGDEGAGGDDEE